MFEGLWKHDGWAVGVIDASAAALLDPARLAPITWLPLRKRHTFFADPFLIRHDDTTVLFCEELPYATNRGHISYVVLDERSGSSLAATPAIVEPYHLSYPFLLRYDGEILCIPEGSASGSIVAYVARRFPHDWVRKATLLDFPGCDPTVFAFDGRWWLLCTNGRTGWNSDLYAFHADQPLGPWRSHANNPVRSDLAGGRPGGRPFVVDGRLYRPVQDCRAHYGGGLLTTEVLALTPDRYEERIVATHVPDPAGPYPHGLHTACVEDDLIAVDGNRFRFEPRQAARAVREKFRTLLPARTPCG